jgi:hypothetical protein
MANERRTAGAPSDLNVKYWSAGVSIGESYKKNIIVQCHYNGHTVIKIQVLDIQGK